MSNTDLARIQSAKHAKVFPTKIQYECTRNLAKSNQINIYELISVCPYPDNMRMISETTCSSQTKLIGLKLHVSEHGIGYSNLPPDPQGAQGAPGVKIQVSLNQKTSLTKVVRHDYGMVKIASAPPEEIGYTCKAGVS